MQTSISYETAIERHPDLVDIIVDDINRKAAKAKRPVVDAAQMEWSYTWAVRIGSGEMLDNIFLSLAGNMNASRSTTHVKADHSTPMQRSLLPPEVAAYHTPPTPIDPATIAHVATFDLKDLNGKSHLCLATGGYRKDGKIIIRYLDTTSAVHQSATEPFQLLAQIEGSNAIWAGSLHRTAKDRYDNTPPGSVFRYRNKPLTRLTDQEVIDAVGNKIFQHAH